LNTDRNLRISRLQILKACEVFSGLSEDDLLELADISVLCNLTRGDTIYREGDNPDYIYIIAEGRIKSYNNSLSGMYIIGNISKDLIGLQNIISGDPCWSSAEAMDNMRVLKVRRQEFLIYLKSKQILLWQIVSRAEKTINKLHNRVITIIGCSSEQKVIDIFYGLYEKFGVLLPFKRYEIASLAGLTRETTTRVISSLRKSGIIKSTSNGIVIKDVNKLRELKNLSPIL
jgi:CRP/FNR family transcriptional regulator, cyclic AMP receptor protein